MTTTGMARDKDTKGLSPKAGILIGTVLCMLAVFGIVGSVLFWNTGRDTGVTLQSPEHLLRTSTEDLSSMVATALQRQRRTTNLYRVKVPGQDNASFRMHFENAAARRGWYTHASSEHRIRVVLPEDELTQLEEIQGDPMGWVQKEAVKKGPAVGPSNLTLANASLTISKAHPRTKQRLAMVGGILFGTILVGLGTLILAMGIATHLEGRPGPGANDS